MQLRLLATSSARTALTRASITATATPLAQQQRLLASAAHLSSARSLSLASAGSRPFELTYMQPSASGHAVPTTATPLYSFIHPNRFRALETAIQEMPDVPPLSKRAQGHALDLVGEEAEDADDRAGFGVYADSVLRKRRKKMNRHKLRQLKRRTRNQDKGAK